MRTDRPRPIDITERRVGAATVLTLRGRLTLESFGLLHTRVRSLMTGGARALVLDLSAVRYVDSTGVAELVQSHVTTTRRGGRLALAMIPSQIDLLLHMTQLDRIFDLFDTVDHAVEGLARTDA